VLVIGQRRLDLAVRLQVAGVDFQDLDGALDALEPAAVDAAPGRPHRRHRELHRVPTTAHEGRVWVALTPMADRARTERESCVRIVWIYPDLLSTYGDQGNALIMAYRAAAARPRGRAVDVRSDQPIPTDGRRVPDRRRRGPAAAAGRRAAAQGPGPAAAVDRGAAVLSVCAGFQISATRSSTTASEAEPGLGLLDVSSTGARPLRRRGGRRPDATLSLGGAPLPALTGFENHMGTTASARRARPLGAVTLGNGNGRAPAPRARWQGKIVGTYLHGPVLARNPALADLLLELGGRRPVADQGRRRLAREAALRATDRRRGLSRPVSALYPAHIRPRIPVFGVRGRICSADEASPEQADSASHRGASNDLGCFGVEGVEGSCAVGLAILICLVLASAAALVITDRARKEHRPERRTPPRSTT
jgi:CobQ-like glutamine amidotransferase family enzyme